MILSAIVTLCILGVSNLALSAARVQEALWSWPLLGLSPHYLLPVASPLCVYVVFIRLINLFNDWLKDQCFEVILYQTYGFYDVHYHVFWQQLLSFSFNILDLIVCHLIFDIHTGVTASR